MVLVYHPLDDSMSKMLNQKNAKLSATVGGIADGITAVVTQSKLATLGATAGARNYMLSKLRSWDAGDILIRFDAKVSGGIGPQHTRKGIVAKRSAYDGVNVKL